MVGVVTVVAVVEATVVAVATGVLAGTVTLTCDAITAGAVAAVVVVEVVVVVVVVEAVVVAAALSALGEQALNPSTTLIAPAVAIDFFNIDDLSEKPQYKTRIGRSNDGNVAKLTNRLTNKCGDSLANI